MYILKNCILKIMTSYRFWLAELNKSYVLNWRDQIFKYECQSAGNRKEFKWKFNFTELFPKDYITFLNLISWVTIRHQFWSATTRNWNRTFQTQCSSIAFRCSWSETYILLNYILKATLPFRSWFADLKSH